MSIIYVFLLSTPTPCPCPQAQTSLNSYVQIYDRERDHLLPSNVTSVPLWSGFTRYSWILRKQDIQNPAQPSANDAQWTALVSLLHSYLCRLFWEMIMHSDFCGHQIRASSRAKHRMVPPPPPNWSLWDPAQLHWGCSRKQNPQKVDWMWPQQMEMKSGEAWELENSESWAKKSLQGEGSWPHRQLFSKWSILSSDLFPPRKA